MTTLWNLCAGWTNVTPWNFHVKTVVIFFAAESRVVLGLYASQPISTGFTDSDNNTAKPHNQSTYVPHINNQSATVSQTAANHH